MTEQNWQDELTAVVKKFGGQVKFNQPLAPHTSFKIGGPADALIVVKNSPALIEIIKFAQNHHFNFTVLGRGTNVLISDQGLRGLVVKLAGDFNRITVDSRLTADGCLLKVGTGVLMDRVAETAEKFGLTGAEFLAGIPGTVGGGLTTNAGAFGHTIAEIIEEVIAIEKCGSANAKCGNSGFRIPNSELRNEYRTPVIPGNLIVLWVVFRLKKGRPEATVSAIRKQRRLKHPNEPSAGSFFKNPPETIHGKPAGRLIEECGLKGLKIGGAKISEKHANFVINDGGARFKDVYEIAQIVKATVEEKTGILLEEEVQILPNRGETILPVSIVSSERRS